MNNTQIPQRIDSPCIGRCCLDDDDICVGCFRTLEEIKAWGMAGDEVRADILKNSAERARRPREACIGE